MSTNTGVICEIRAGKCIVQGKLVSPDLRRGILRLYRGEDDLVCVQWLTIDDGVVEDSLYVFGDAQLKRIDECTTGAVYVLEFVGNDQKTLYWMQSKSTDEIESFVKAFNKAADFNDTTKTGALNLVQAQVYQYAWASNLKNWCNTP